MLIVVPVKPKIKYTRAHTPDWLCIQIHNIMCVCEWPEVAGRQGIAFWNGAGAYKAVKTSYVQSKPSNIIITTAYRMKPDTRIHEIRDAPVWMKMFLVACENNWTFITIGRGCGRNQS